MSKDRPEDQMLDPRQFPRINDQFYKAEPADYFESRIRMMVLLAGNPTAVRDLFRQGVKLGELAMIDDGSDPETTDASIDHYAAAEAELVGHHVGETLLRLYLAHEFRGRKTPPACPRLEMARLRSGSDFTERIRQRFLRKKARSEEVADRRAIARVFHMTEERSEFGNTGPTDEQWNESIDFHALYLEHFAKQFVDDGPLYNSAKHGLALSHEDAASVSLGNIVGRKGPAIRFLDMRRRAGDPIPRWSDVLHWVQVDRQAAIALIGVAEIRALWRAARMRYTATADRKILMAGGPTPLDVLWPKEKRSEGQVGDLAWELHYFERPRDAPVEYTLE
jgi:hypothetical protein